MNDLYYIAEEREEKHKNYIYHIKNISDGKIIATFTFPDSMTNINIVKIIAGKNIEYGYTFCRHFDFDIEIVEEIMLRNL
jgi:hypothetical protein